MNRYLLDTHVLIWWFAKSKQLKPQLKEIPLLHQDPFDRIQIAQSQVASLTLVTHDRIIRKYPNLSVLKA